MKPFLFILSLIIISGCIAKEMDFDVFDEKGTSSSCTKGG